MIARFEEDAYVVDASVGIKWVIEEEHSPVADLLLMGTKRLIVPDRFYSEVANVLWKRTRRGNVLDRISVSDARDGLTQILSVRLETIPSAELVAGSMEIALETGRSTYDCDYLALALRMNAPFVTADDRFYRAVASHPHYGSLLMWIDRSRPADL